MFRRLSKRRAQSTLEYAILIGVIVGGLVAMQIYVKRAFHGKMRESADSMGTQFNPELTSYNYTTNSHYSATDVLADEVSTSTILDQTTNKTGSENVRDLNQEVWW